MKLVEIITLRSPIHINGRLLDQLLKGINASDLPTDTRQQLVQVKMYHHPVVETDLSIHIYWKSEKKNQDKSPLGLRFSSALKGLGLLNHSLWIETAARESFARNKESAEPCDLPAGNCDAAQQRISEGRES